MPYGRANQIIHGDGDTDLFQWLISIIGDTPALIFGMWQCLPNVEPRRQLVWDKCNFGLSGSDLPWINSHEVAWVYGKGWIGSKRGTVYKTPRHHGAVHPTQKPVDLMKWILSCAGPAWKIIDPFMGSGTTLEAAKLMGRQCIGIEREEKYCEIAARRLSQECLFSFDEAA